MTTYTVKTDLDPENLNDLAVYIFEKWIAFANGKDSLGGKRLMHPTGKYASAISMEKRPNNVIAIIADGSVPEVGILEKGHGVVDLKTKPGFIRAREEGRPLPMHRAGGYPGVNVMTAEPGHGNFNGMAFVGETGWILPQMPAYAPGRILAKLARSITKGL